MKRNIKWQYLLIAIGSCLPLLIVSSYNLGLGGLGLIPLLLLFVIAMIGSSILFILSVVVSFFVSPENYEKYEKRHEVGWKGIVLVAVISTILFFYVIGRFISG